ncbi:putative alphaglucosidase [Phaeomoniella chlamydospora]|uniref:Putative alphaglucosidase n=1 Tax=Phaeomoniella chlamydospora TaxID=158046 RepID=A0A0G2DYF2_PHACM|nr:putative alphaglucosidase [Phaeomoniella chlamydospora]
MAASARTIRIGYVPEHYLLPLHLSRRYVPSSLKFDLVPFPSGTGHMITSLRTPSSSSESIDLAIGLTEGWIAGLLPPNLPSGRKKGYNLIGQWVQNPLRWAIVTGIDRGDITSISDLGRKTQNHRKLRVGVSRIGSGSHVMANVLAQQHGWDPKGLEFIKCGPFADLRTAVNVQPDLNHTSTKDGADFFMWEHFTTKPYFHPDPLVSDHDSKVVLKRLGEIYTPWPSWCVVTSEEVFPDPCNDQSLSQICEVLDKGIQDFEGDREKGIKMLGTGELGCHYTEEDAREWLKKAKFEQRGIRGVDRAMVEGVVEVLRGAGVVDVPDSKAKEVDDVVVIER